MTLFQTVIVFLLERIPLLLLLWQHPKCSVNNNILVYKCCIYLLKSLWFKKGSHLKDNRFWIGSWRKRGVHFKFFTFMHKVVSPMDLSWYSSSIKTKLLFISFDLEWLWICCILVLKASVPCNSSNSKWCNVWFLSISLRSFTSAVSSIKILEYSTRLDKKYSTRKYSSSIFNDRVILDSTRLKSQCSRVLEITRNPKNRV